MYFIGLDLAFSSKNNTGIAVLQGTSGDARSPSRVPAMGHDEESLQFVTSGLAKSDESIVDVILPYLVPGETVVAVDAPLIVPNDRGMRECERAVGRVFGSKGGAAYPSNQGNMAGTRGPSLLRKLEDLGFTLWTEPSGKPMHASNGPTGLSATPTFGSTHCTGPGIHLFETYPHAAHLALFGLTTVWKYKKKTGRSWELCQSELALYWQRLMQLMPNVIEQLLHADNDALGARLQEWGPVLMEAGTPPSVRGVRYKEFEDLTDGLFCAYIAAHIHMGREAMLFSSGSEGSRDLSRYEPGDGFILVPATPARVPALGQHRSPD